MSTNTIFITGTDTDAGKTVLTSALAAKYRADYPDKNLGLMKLMQTGTGDREWYDRLFANDEKIEVVTPLHFQEPLAPPMAAELEDRPVSLDIVWKAYRELQGKKDFLLLEALGGLGSPVTRELTVADIAAEWRLPTVLVVPVKLGSIGHTIANVALARQRGIDLRGIVLNGVTPDTSHPLELLTPPDLIEELTRIPVWGVLSYCPDRSNLDLLKSCLDDRVVDRLFPQLSNVR